MKYNRDLDEFKEHLDKYNRDLDAFKEHLDKLKDLTDKMEEKLDNKWIFSKKTRITVCSNWNRFSRGVHRAYKTIIAYIKKGISNENE